MSVQQSSRLDRINQITSSLSVIGCLIILFMLNTDASSSAVINWYYSFLLLFFYFHLLFKDLSTNILFFKKEASQINYPVNLGLFFLSLFMLAAGCIIILFLLNRDAVNTASALNFCMALISIFMPSIVLLAFIYFVSPALIIPGLSEDKGSEAVYKTITYILLILYSAFLIFKIASEYKTALDYEAQNKYKAAKLNITFSEEALKMDAGISPYAKKLMESSSIKVPFYYTVNPIAASLYKEAENLCASMGAKVPNHLEMYNIAFSNFAAFGDKYYWTSAKDGRENIVLHVKNTVYTLKKRPAGVRPFVYCVMTAPENGIKNIGYFYRKYEPKKIKPAHYTVNNPEDGEKFKSLEDLLNKSAKPVNFRRKRRMTDTIELDGKKYSKNSINTDKKHVNFSVKIVPPEMMQQLIKKGYNYNPKLDIRPEYEASDYQVSEAAGSKSQNIRLCYYPFMDYGSLSINQERSIWEQSFCSPAFRVLTPRPEYISASQAGAKCTELGGRLPNIPELAAVLKTAGSNAIGADFWTNNTINDINGVSKPLAAYYKDLRFMAVKTLNPDRKAFAYCIGKSQPPSKVIANYRSKFRGYNGSDYAKSICPSCYYYEVPDVIQR